MIVSNFRFKPITFAFRQDDTLIEGDIRFKLDDESIDQLSQIASGIKREDEIEDFEKQIGILTLAQIEQCESRALGSSLSEFYLQEGERHSFLAGKDPFNAKKDLILVCQYNGNHRWLVVCAELVPTPDL